MIYLGEDEDDSYLLKEFIPQLTKAKEHVEAEGIIDGGPFGRPTRN
jgi:hypothetical protein